MNPTGNSEEIRISIPVDSSQVDAANKKIRDLEKNAEGSIRKIEVVQRSANSLRQITERLERQSAGFGLTGNERAIAMARLSLEKLRSDEALFARGKNALDQMIEKQKTLAAQTEQATKSNESFFGSFLKAEFAVRAIEKLNAAISGVIGNMARYAAGTELFILSARSVAISNGETAQSADNLMQKLQRMGITTRDSARAVSQSLTGGMGTKNLTQLARMAQDVAVMAPESTSSDVLTRMLYAIQSAQPEMLRTVGVNVNFEKAYSDFAKSAKRTTDSLTENEKAQIRLQNVLEKGRRWAGLYEESLGTVGKQIQQLDRHSKEAANAIGQNLLPALGLLVRSATWISKKVAEDQHWANALTIAGATGTSAAAGAAIGGAIGSMAGGVGAVPGAVIGAKTGGWIGLGLSTASVMYSGMNPGDIDVGKLSRNVQKSMRAAPALAEEQADRYWMERLSREKAQEEAANKANTERFRILEAIASVRERELTGIAKINAEHERMLRQLKEEKLDTAQLVELAGDLRRAKLQAFVDDNAKRVREMRMEVGAGITAGTTQSKIATTLDLEPQDINDLFIYQRQLDSRKPFNPIESLAYSAELAIDQYEEASKAAKKSADEWQRSYESMYNHLRSGFESTFDSIIRNGANAAQVLKNLFLTALLTPIKQAASAMFANLFMPLMNVQGGRMSGGFGVGGATGGNIGGFGSLATGSLGMAGMIGPGGTAPFAGGGGGFGNFRGMGANLLGSLTQLGNIGMGNAGGLPSSVAMLNPYFKSPSGVGGWQGGAMLAGGGILAADGLRRGGWYGMAETTAGGALIGFKFGGPMGALIGGAIGAGVGLFRMLFKGAEDKAREKIKNYYGVDIADKSFLKMIVAMAKQTYGGNIDVAIRSREVRDMIELYAMSTGQKMGALDNVARGINLSQSGGLLYQTGSYVNGVGYSYGGAIQSISGLSKFAAPTAVPIVLDAEGTKQFWSDVMATGIVQNPRAVQAASLSAHSQNYGRTSAAVQLTDPLGATI